MQRKTLWESYKALNPRTRVSIGVAGMAFATAGMFISDWLEESLPPTEIEKQELVMMSPIVVVDHESPKKATDQSISQ
ncbi:hypothetical protein J3Q64DRAFT_1832693 [Phycomyces blakesleeanus]|uniref:Uncharacterized protein n=2 Tax=Phycomyces blakesleeanus TaxID=4837 RepID=A0A162PQP8_PHYB8|nr:hypothetical protein PHYBLDRAFT_147014 [Phycomyces blakesleeanus NRRL 1555(-)]OAD72036.1 hypothetical protein PHYBLDRAFT_147014 [Phycomyces blakesleeanus NRRL 1555(-)]|eukprot:XP_018290076.1 hypothetical protein PHYBLDRAFT_147014 [Phycomyces blakesleeanus NRRL 1555(-)]